MSLGYHKLILITNKCANKCAIKTNIHVPNEMKVIELLV